MTAILEIDVLQVEIGAQGSAIQAVNRLSLSVQQGESLVIVGESGSGKSVGLMTALRLLPEPPFRVTGGHVRFKGEDIRNMSLRKWRQLAGREVGMVFQDALTSLNPVFTVGWQIAERLRVQGVSRDEARMRAVELMRQVGIADAERRYSAYPHQLSGGMRQRIMIAIAIVSGPSLLICDEPTTALDVTIQAQILELLSQRQAESSSALIMVTHDLAVASEIADRIAVVYAGQVVETGTADEVLFHPLHPYTAALLAAMPSDEIGQLPRPIPGVAPSLSQIPPGCPFAPRCTSASAICRTQPPSVVQVGKHSAFCHHPVRTDQ